MGALNFCTSQLLYSLITLKKLFFWGRGSGGFSRWVHLSQSRLFKFLFPPSPSFTPFLIKFMALFLDLNYPPNSLVLVTRGGGSPFLAPLESVMSDPSHHPLTPITPPTHTHC